MLDRVDPSVLEVLLGDNFTPQVVDRVTLASVRIDDALESQRCRQRPSETFEHEQAVDLVRVTGGHLKATHFVNGWPAGPDDAVRRWSTPRDDAWCARLDESRSPGAPAHERAADAIGLRAAAADDQHRDGFLRLREPRCCPPTRWKPRCRSTSVQHSLLVADRGTLLGFSVAS